MFAGKHISKTVLHVRLDTNLSRISRGSPNKHQSRMSLLYLKIQINIEKRTCTAVTMELMNFIRFLFFHQRRCIDYFPLSVYATMCVCACVCVSLSVCVCVEFPLTIHASKNFVLVLSIRGYKYTPIHRQLQIYVWMYRVHAYKNITLGSLELKTSVKGSKNLKCIHSACTTKTFIFPFIIDANDFSVAKHLNVKYVYLYM